MNDDQHWRHTLAGKPSSSLESGHRSARAQRLIERTFTDCERSLRELLRLYLTEFEQQLFATAERAHRPELQHDWLASHQRVSKDRAGLIERFVSGLTSAFNQLGNPAPLASESVDGDWQSLELIDTGTQELELAMTQLGVRGEVRHSSALYELGHRMAVLVARPPLEGAALPLGPHALTRALGQASEVLALPQAHQLLLLQCFDKHVLQRLGPTYDAVNAGLQGDGILPNLRSAVPNRSPGPRIRHADPGTTKKAAADEPADAPEPATPRMANTDSAGSGGSLEVLESLRNLLAQQRGSQAYGNSNARVVASTEELQTALSALQQHMAEVTDRTSRELRSARELRQELLNQLNQGKPLDMPRTELTGEQVDTVELVSMLFEQLVQQLQHGGDARALMSRLQLPVLNMAVTDRSFFETPEHPARKLLDTVAAAANDWIDGSGDEGDRALADKLGQLVERVNHEPPSAGLYTTLLADIEHHLALLSRKAQAAERRQVEAAKGREKLAQARRQAGELIAARFAQAPPQGLLRTVLDRAWADVLALTLLRHGMDSDACSLQLRITDQLLGHQAIDDRQELQAQIIAGLLQIGMQHEEAGHLAQRLLTSVPDTTSTSEPAPRTTAASAPTTTADPTAESTQAPAAPAPPTLAATPVPAANPEPMPAPAPAAEVKPAPQPAASPAPEPSTNNTPPGQSPAKDVTATTAPSATQIAQRLKQHHRPREPVVTTSASPAIPRVESQPVLGPQEARIHNRLRQLPFGSWFEFTDPASGQRTQRKLAWFSPVSGNVLFVTRRGFNTGPMTLVQLAQAMAAGQVREVQAENDSLLDRAWHSLTRNLRQPAPKSIAAGKEPRR